VSGTIREVASRTCGSATLTGGEPMPDSVYRVTELVGVSPDGWEAAAKSAIETASGSLRDLRIAEVVRQDLTIADGQVTGYRVRLNVSFKYDPQGSEFSHQPGG
jgi:flavin-binding protein dodecin